MKALCLTLLSALLGACTSPLGQAPTPAQAYLLVTPSRLSNQASALQTEGSLRVRVTSVGPGLASEKIASIEQQQQQPLSGLRWIEPLPELIEKTAVAHLGAQFPAWYVSRQLRPGTGVELLLDVQQFAVNVAQSRPQRVQTAIQWRLIDHQRQQIIGSGRLESVQDIDENSKTAVMAAFATANEGWLDGLTAALQPLLTDNPTTTRP